MAWNNPKWGIGGVKLPGNYVLSVEAGSGQVIGIGGETLLHLKAKVLNGAEVVPDDTVTFYPSCGTLAAQTAISGDDGVADIGSFTAGTSAGIARVTATAYGCKNQAMFLLDVVEPNTMSWTEATDVYTHSGYNFTSFEDSQIRRVNGIISGDSILAPTNRNGVPAMGMFAGMAKMMRDSAGRRIWVSTDISYGGHTIQDQQVLFEALPTATKVAAPFFILQAGANNVNHSRTVLTLSEMMGYYQAYINVVKASCPTAKIIMSAMTPFKSYTLTMTNGVERNALYNQVQEAITDLTGVDAFVTEHTALLSDGAGSLKILYNNGDNIHVNNTGRYIIGDKWYDKLHLLGLL